MDLIGVMVILLVACLTVASICLGLVIYMFIILRRRTKEHADSLSKLDH